MRKFLCVLVALLALWGAALAETVEPVDRQSSNTILLEQMALETLPTNEDYSVLTFQFSSVEDPTVHEVCIAGIKLEPEFDREDDPDDLLRAMAATVADRFYAHQSLTLSSEESFAAEFGLSFQTIDAEKVHLDKSSGWENTDAEMCWAGSVSNMLIFSGWGQTSTKNTFSNEDELYDYFERSFTDDGLKQAKGLKWFFNGVNPDQERDSDGHVMNGNDTVDSLCSQERWTDDATKNGADLAGYAQEALGDGYDAANEGCGALLQSLLKLKEGQSTGLGVGFVSSSGQEGTGHAVTAMGYIRNPESDESTSLEAIFISDPDNSKEDGAERAELPNILEMYPVKEGSYTNNWSIEVSSLYLELYGGVDYDAVDLDNLDALFDENVTEDDIPTNKTFILTYASLLPYDDEALLVGVEEEGSQNALKDVDFAVTRCLARDSLQSDTTTAAVEEDVWLWCKLINASYVLPDVSNRPYLMMTFTITAPDGTEEKRTAQIYLDSQDARTQAPGLEVEVSLGEPFRPKQEGSYTVNCHIDGIYYRDESGTEVPVQEAYTGNNQALTAFTLTVTDDGLLSDDETEKSAPQPEVIYRVDMHMEDDSDSCSVALPGLEQDDLKVTDQNGEPVENVTYSRTETGAALILGKDYLEDADGLSVLGLQIYCLRDGEGNAVAWVEMSMM